jgi:hypothetical protein
MPTQKEALDYLGEFLMKCHRDQALFTLETAFKGGWKVESFQGFQEVIKSLSSEQQEKLFDGFESMITGALHDLLFSLQEENDFKNRIHLMVDGYDAVKMSDGLHGEQFTDDGWIARFSKYKKTK